MMRTRRPTRKSVWLAVTAVTAASLLLTACGASKSPPPDQIAAPGPEADSPVSEVAAAEAGTEIIPSIPATSLLPAPADGSDGSGDMDDASDGRDGGSGNPARDDSGEAGRGAAAQAQAETEPADDEFLLVADFASLPVAVQRWHDAKREHEGAFQLNDGGQSYLLISAGAMPTGGYSLTLRSLTETSTGWRLEVELHKPSPNAMVTQVVTYPSLFFTAPPGDVEVILYEGGQSRTLPLNAGGGDVR